MRITQVSKSTVAESAAGDGSGDLPLLPLSSSANGATGHGDSATDGHDVDDIDADDATQVTVTSADACLLQSLEVPPASNTTPASGLGRPDFKGVAQMGRIMSNYQHDIKKTRTQRLVQKNGDCNITSHNVMKRNRKYLVDIFTTLVDMKWRYHLLMFAAAFVVTWFLFGIVWFTIAIGHKDDVYANNETWQACVDNVFDFKTALLFSIETQHTIGYGYRVIQAECHLAICVMMLQSCLGLFIQSLITGIIFSKISRPKGRAQTIMFSHKAVICQRDGEYCLLFRVGDMRKSHIIGTSIRALLVKNRQTSEGESIPICQYPLNIETETSTSDSFVFLIWPVTIVHKINSTSPLWDLGPIGLMKDHFEVIVILEGTIESTGMLTQMRTSYIPAEVIWGERLVPLMTYQLNGHCEIDYTQFHNTTPMYMPDISAKEYEEVRIRNAVQPVEKDYPSSFTAPAIGVKPRRSTVYGLFPRRPSKQSGSSLKVRSTNKSKIEQQQIKKANKAQQNALEEFDVTSVDGVGRLPITSAAGDLIEFGSSLPSHQFKRHTAPANGSHSRIKAPRTNGPSHGGKGSATKHEQGVNKA